MAGSFRDIYTRPGRRETDALLSSLGRYTKFVFVSKWSLLALSCAAIFTIIIIPVLNADKEGLRIAFESVQEKAESLPMMSNPKFQGVDENNQPYTITADSAIQQDQETVQLANLQADIFLNDNTWLNVSAQTGWLKTEAKTLDLSKQVYIFHDKGYEFRTERAYVDMQTHTVQGDQIVEGQGPMGTITADGFRLEQEREAITFIGNVKMVVFR